MAFAVDILTQCFPGLRSKRDLLLPNPALSDVSVCEINRGTLLEEGFGSSFNSRSEDEIETV